MASTLAIPVAQCVWLDGASGDDAQKHGSVEWSYLWMYQNHRLYHRQIWQSNWHALPVDTSSIDSHTIRDGHGNQCHDHKCSMCRLVWDSLLPINAIDRWQLAPFCHPRCPTDPLKALYISTLYRPYECTMYPNKCHMPHNKNRWTLTWSRKWNNSMPVEQRKANILSIVASHLWMVYNCIELTWFKCFTWRQ